MLNAADFISNGTKAKLKCLGVLLALSAYHGRESISGSEHRSLRLHPPPGLWLCQQQCRVDCGQDLLVVAGLRRKGRLPWVWMSASWAGCLHQLSRRGGQKRRERRTGRYRAILSLANSRHRGEVQHLGRVCGSGLGRRASGGRRATGYPTRASMARRMRSGSVGRHVATISAVCPSEIGRAPPSRASRLPHVAARGWLGLDAHERHF